MKSVLISTRPKWCEKICHEIGKEEAGKPIYEKRIEVRKTAPKEVPFKAFIYCTKTKNKWSLCDNEGAYQNSKGEIVYAQQHIIGEFICDKITKYRYTKPWLYNGKSIYHLPIDTINTCLSYEEIEQYLGNKDGYGWHISDLKIYDRPRELSEFRKKGFMTEEEWLFNLYPNTHCHYEAWAKKFEIARPPQSWCYVEELCKAQN